MKKQSRRLVDLLHHNLRMTDEKGVLSATRYGVLLVDTPEMGGRAVLDRMTVLFADARLNVRLSLQVHDADGFGGKDDHPSGNGTRRDDESGSKDWVRRPSEILDVTTTALEKAGAVSDVTVCEPIHVPGEASGASIAGVQQQPALMQSGETVADSQVSIAGSESTEHWPLASRIAKRVVDVVGASVGLVVTSPFLIASMIAIKWDDGGPVMFCQTREGRYGRPFTIYKLRTMVVDAEKSQAALRAASHRDGPAFKISKDPRVTKVGHFLRATCLDELPQLINVLKGDMSLVGPRPLPWHESRACERWHRRRLDVRPGLTCIWQIDKSKAETFDDWMRMDLRYIDRLGFFDDLHLIARTVVVPVTGRGGE
ncbi:sugar transferase [Rhodopirellula sallentina]|uniref:sugar transferase n=1 Tax=Rhodopirellula sallentina TaxID=1263869 RepID=UPI001F1CB98C|nr:sugar transferase [Rhodopirellula sallentina]